MARFMVKASEYKNVCKAVNDRNLAELKKEIIEILKKQDEKDFKKAIDYLESQELYFTHLEKSFNGKWIEKAGYGVGTVRIWKGKKYKKIAPGKWARVFDKEGRGTNIAIGKLIAKVQKIDNVEDLMAFVMQNKQRFVDENGVDLPVLDKLRAAVDARNNGGMGNKGTSSKTKIGEGKVLDYKNNPSFDKYKNMSDTDLDTAIKNLTIRVDDMEKQLEDNKDNENVSLGIASVKSQKNLLATLKQIKEDKKNGTSKTAEKKEDLEAALKEVEDAIDNAGDYDDIEELENERQKILKKLGKNEKPSEKKKTFKQEMNELYDAQDKAWEGFESGSEIKSTPENSKKFYDRVKKFVEENNIKLTEKHRAEIEDQNGHSFNEALALAGAYGEDEKEKALAKNRENAEKYKGAVLDLSMIDEFKTEESEEEKLPENSKETPMPKPSTGVYAPSESTNLETKKAIAENKSIGENEVQMPYSKELENEIKTLKNNVSDDPTRQFMGHVYYDDGVLVASDGRRLKIVKVGKLDGIENGSYVDINISKDGINLKKREGMEDAMFPNYRGVIPDNLTQKVALNNKVIKDKIKEMKKDGAIDRKLNLIQLEFKNGKVYLDDTEIGEAKDIDLKYNGDDTNYVNVNAEYLSDALSGNTSTLMLSKDARKAMAISTESTSNIVMPMNQEGKVDYSENRKKKAYEQAKKDSVKQANIERNKNLLDGLSEDKVNSLLDGINNSINERIKTWSDDDLKRAYEKFGLNFNKLLEKPLYTIDTVADKKTGTTLRVAYLHEKLKEKYPEVKDKIVSEMEKRGISVKKSLFDDFIIDVFEADEDEEIEDAIKADETEYNDYSAEQPELFNSVDFAVREALNRRHNCIM